MTDRLAGKVALVTGAARGQGRAHAIQMTLEGAAVVALDNCADVPTTAYAGATEVDLAETARLVQSQGGRVLTVRGDVRVPGDLTHAVEAAIDTFGRLDIVVANAGVFSSAPSLELSSAMWDDCIAVNLTGVWNTCQAAIPAIRAGERGGSIIITSSLAGLRPTPNAAHYTAAKHAVTGLMYGLARGLAPERIRVNSIHPTAVDTPMIQNEALYRLFIPDAETVTREEFTARSATTHLIPTPWVTPDDIAHAAVFLASDETRFITGCALPVDAGALLR